MNAIAPAQPASRPPSLIEARRTAPGARRQANVKTNAMPITKGYRQLVDDAHACIRTLSLG